jgi:hypothetical protein
MVQALERLDLEYPPVTEEQKAALEQARKALGEE